MAKCCGDDNKAIEPGEATPPRCASANAAENIPENGPLAWFGKMIENCYEYAKDAKAKGRHIVGIMCVY